MGPRFWPPEVRPTHRSARTPRALAWHTHCVKLISAVNTHVTSRLVNLFTCGQRQKVSPEKFNRLVMNRRIPAELPSEFRRTDASHAGGGTLNGSSASAGAF